MAENTKANKLELKQKRAEARKAREEAIAAKLAALPKKNRLDEVEKALLAEQNNTDKFPVFNVGDTVRVHVKIKEGDKERIQPYEGVVMMFQNAGPRRSFTVRRVSYGVAIERVFPFHSPYIAKVEVVRRGRVRRAKLTYLRGRFGRSAVLEEKV
ncbi:LSU ribosomal protein L19p [Brevinematales bacterium NS]|jgi:large subunit ribosomal protein L19|nr:50S ribosomal protein L19 [Brevinematales bacterium]QJR21210.1 LSU ribosomal protein L19p [Brevinematales bacterium NS]